MIDTSRLYYDGNSQGGIIGGALIAVAPDLDRGVIGVNGMNYSTLLRRSVDFDTYAQFLYNAYPDELERPGAAAAAADAVGPRGGQRLRAAHDHATRTRTRRRTRCSCTSASATTRSSNYAAKVEARTVGAHAFAPWTDPGPRHRPQPLSRRSRRSGAASYGGAAAIVMWDSGSPVAAQGRAPAAHGRGPARAARAAHRSGQQQKSDFLRPGGVFKDVCGAKPCYAGDKAPSPSLGRDQRDAAERGERRRRSARASAARQHRDARGRRSRRVRPS